MGQIQLPPSPPVVAAEPSALDELPSYDEVTQPIEPYRDSESDGLLSPPPDAYEIPGQQTYQSIRPTQRFSGSVTLDPSYSSDPRMLESLIESQTRLPPRPCLSIHGSHRETRRSGNETKNENVTDFDFRIDLTRTILRWGRNEASGPSVRWSYTTVVSDHDGQKAYRGGRIRSRAGKAKPGRIALGDGVEGERLMELESQEDYPGIRGWCERFCSDPAPVKSFTYRRTLHGFDANPMRTSLTSHIRSTGYQGHIVINPVIANGFVTVYSPHWINTLRNNAYVYWICIVLQLWLITWPVIWFMERRYEVVRSEWFSSKTVADASAPGGSRKCYAAAGMDEAKAAELWAPIVREAAWQGRAGGCILGDAEIETLRRQGIERREQLGEGRDLLRRGQSVLGAMGIRSIGGVNVTGAWGGDSSSASSSRFSIRMG